MPAEDGIRAGRRELAALVGVARLEDDRAALRAARHVELARDVEVRVVVRERARARGGQELPGGLVGHDLGAVPRAEQLPGGAQERPGPLVTLILGQVTAAAEVLAGERVPGRHHVPRGPAAGQVVEAGELPGHLVRLVERGVDRPGQAEPVGDRGQRGQHGERVRPADHVQVVDLAALLAQPQPLGQEQEVELGPLGGLGQVHERAELDVAAGPRVAPHRRVVDAGEVGGQVDLLGWRGTWVLPGWFRPGRTGWPGGAGRAAHAAARPGSAGGTRRAAAAREPGRW